MSSGSEPKAKAKKPKDLVNELQVQVSELTDALQRERADVINTRRRHDEQVASLKTHVKGEVVSQLLPVIDNFERALKHVPKELDGNNYIKGVQGVVKLFEKTLQDIGVERIKTIDEVFNPEIHEAVGVEDKGGDTEVVSEELQAGYRVDNNVIRPAIVKVVR